MPNVILKESHFLYDCSDPSLSLNLDLVGYEMAFQQFLESAGDFRAFKRKVTKELERLGFSHWSYLRLDIPRAFGIDKIVSTFPDDYLKLYQEENYALHDLMPQHLETSRTHIYRSTLTKFVEESPIETESMRQNKALFAMYDSFGYYDCIAIPIHSKDRENHAIFTLTSKGDSSKIFQDKVSAVKEKLRIIIKLVEEVGVDRFSEYFLGPKSEFFKIASGRALKLLELMSRKDLNISQAAEVLHMSRTAADKQLAKIREYLCVNTTHGALLVAIKKGLITVNKR